LILFIDSFREIRHLHVRNKFVSLLNEIKSWNRLPCTS